MAVTSPSLPLRRTMSGSALVVVGGLTLVLMLAGRLAGLGDSASLQTFAILFVAISVEALPFVLLGALVASAVEIYVSDRTFSRFTRLPNALQMPAAALAGFAFPVCECGSVPVARRFMRRGVHPGAAVAFMMAAPIFNPIVLASTLVAYSPRGLGVQMLLGRAGLGLVLALAAGWALGTEGATEMLRAREDEGAHDHDHSADPASDKRRAFVARFTNDFLFMGRFLIAGAMLSAALQTVIPRTVLAGVARTPIIAVLALMLVAFISSLCSEADAFVAVSFTPFPLGAQLAFLVFGPVLDFKLAFLYGGTFRKRFALRLAVIAVPVVLAGSLWFEALMNS